MKLSAEIIVKISTDIGVKTSTHVRVKTRENCIKSLRVTLLTSVTCTQDNCCLFVTQHFYVRKVAVISFSLAGGAEQNSETVRDTIVFLPLLSSVP